MAFPAQRLDGSDDIVVDVELIFTPKHAPDLILVLTSEMDDGSSGYMHLFSCMGPAGGQPIFGLEHLATEDFEHGPVRVGRHGLDFHTGHRIRRTTEGQIQFTGIDHSERPCYELVLGNFVVVLDGRRQPVCLMGREMLPMNLELRLQCAIEAVRADIQDGDSASLDVVQELLDASSALLSEHRAQRAGA